MNAIYFKGNWEKQFPKENTRERPFRVSKVRRMFHKAKEVLETVPGVLLVYGSCQEGDLKELEPPVALAAQMWIRANPGFLSPCSSSEVSSGVVCAAGVPSCIAHPRGQLAGLWAY